MQESGNISVCEVLRKLLREELEQRCKECLLKIVFMICLHRGEIALFGALFDLVWLQTLTILTFGVFWINRCVIKTGEIGNLDRVCPYLLQSYGKYADLAKI